MFVGKEKIVVIQQDSLGLLEGIRICDAISFFR